MTTTDPGGASASGRPRAAGPAPRLVVPAYAHPSTAPDLWDRLAAASAQLRLVVVNPHDGPGDGRDDAYPPVVSRLLRAGVRCAGYVDTAYGERTAADVAADVRTYARRWGLRAVFLDQVSSGLDQLEHYAAVVRLARAAGARFVALNPGTHPHPGYVDLANLTVSFEGVWADYTTLAVPAWTRELSPGRLCHLVHGVPTDELTTAMALAADRGISAVLATDGSGPNPWDRLPPQVVAACERRAADAVTEGQPTAQSERPDAELVPRRTGGAARAAGWRRYRP